MVDVESGVLWQYGDDALLAAIRDVERERLSADARMLALLGEAENRGLATAKGHGSSRKLLCELLGISRGEANRRLASAGAVTGKRGLGGEAGAPVLPTVGAALAEGAVSVEHVEVVERFHASLPATVTGEEWEPAEKILADLARGVGPAALRRFAGTHVRARLDPDGTLPRDREQARPKRRLELHRRGRRRRVGQFRIGRGTFRAARGIAVRVDRAQRHRYERAGHASPGRSSWRRARRHRGPRRLPRGPSGRGRRQAPDRGHGNVGGSPSRRPARTAGRAAATDFTASAARRLACDARIVPAVLGSHSEVLDIGRAARTIPAAIRRAVILRDGGCTFPGCDRPPAWTDCHHVRHWADGGPTSLDNLALLCNQHHRTIHHTDWHMYLAADGRPEFLPPGWFDPDRTPRRNPLHQRR